MKITFNYIFWGLSICFFETFFILSKDGSLAGFLPMFLATLITIPVQFIIVYGIYKMLLCLFVELKSFILKTLNAFRNLDTEKRKKITTSILAFIIFATIYQVFFRYKYTTYKSKYGNGAYVVKVDRLTGKSEITYPTLIERK